MGDTVTALAAPGPITPPSAVTAPRTASVTAPVVELRGVHVRFPAREASPLTGVDLRVDAGEAVLLEGASGCGKSTLLSVLTGVVPQSVTADVEGHVSVLGRDPRVTPVARHALDIGRLGQDPASGTCLPTVATEVALTLENHGVPAAEIGARVHAALADVGAAHLASRRTAELSGGEQQRVALAAVLAGDPALLLLDEPTSMLDPVAAARVLDVLAREASRRTTVLAAHRLPEGAWRPRRVVRLAGGRVVADVADAGVLGACLDPAPLGTRTARTVRDDVVLRVRDGAVAQGGRDVVRRIRLDLRRGEVTAVVGRNGSGKSSLLLGLAGFLPVDGVVGGAGAAPGKARASEPPPALVLQRPEQQLLTRSAADEVAWGLRRAAPRAPWWRRLVTAGGDGGAGSASPTASADAVGDAVAAALAQAGLAHLAGADPFRLSGGEQRRLAIAAMSVLDRPVLLLDEPTCGLDDAAARRVVALVDALAARGTAVVLATHDLALARAIADRVLVLRDGDPVAAGGPEVLDDAALLADAGLLAPASGDAAGAGTPGPGVGGAS